MSNDDKALVERLRDSVLYGDARLHNPAGHDPLRMNAADRIEALSAENERLREALQWLVDNDETFESGEPVEFFDGLSWSEVNARWLKGLNRARAALGEQQ